LSLLRSTLELAASHLDDVALNFIGVRTADDVPSPERSVSAGLASEHGAQLVLELFDCRQLRVQRFRKRAQELKLRHPHGLGDAGECVLGYDLVLGLAQQQPNRWLVVGGLNLRVDG
jgi:hypothetical protein